MSVIDRKIKATARILLSVPETPICGNPSVMLIDRENAVRLIAAAFDEVRKQKVEVEQ